MQRVLTKEQIDKAKLMRKEGFTQVRLAEYFGVGATTIWENVYAKAKRLRKEREAKFRDIPTLIRIVINMKEEGYTSKQVSGILTLPLEETNYIFGHFKIKDGITMRM